MRIHRKHYHLNESDSVEGINGDTRKASVKCEEKNRQASEKTGMQPLQPGRSSRNTAGQSARPVQSPKDIGRQPAPSVPTSGKIKIVVAVIGLAVVLGKIIEEYNEPVIKYEYSDPYEYLERELLETGEHYETELEPGEYLVGVHLPEGAYTAELLEGSASFNVDDFENGINLWQAFGTDEEYNQVETLEDIRLFTGAHVSVDVGVVLQMTTENGQTEQLEAIPNPLTETVTLKKDETMAAGEDFPAGVYDLSSTSDRTELRCKIPDEDYEEGFYEISYWLSADDRYDICRNVYLREGVEITAEEGQLLLTPSEFIGSGDYEEYYKYY